MSEQHEERPEEVLARMWGLLWVKASYYRDITEVIQMSPPSKHGQLQRALEFSATQLSQARLRFIAALALVPERELHEWVLETWRLPEEGADAQHSGHPEEAPE